MSYKIRPNPDPRSEYPVHLHQKDNWIGFHMDNECYFYECRTYDKTGRLQKTEIRPPVDRAGRAGRLRSFDLLFTGYAGPDDNGG